jgi:putative membrane protein
MYWDHGWGMGWMMIWGSVLSLLIIAAVIWAAIKSTSVGLRVDDVPETILKRRYARGEIDRDEYERRLHDIRK